MSREINKQKRKSKSTPKATDGLPLGDNDVRTVTIELKDLTTKDAKEILQHNDSFMRGENSSSIKCNANAEGEIPLLTSATKEAPVAGA